MRRIALPLLGCVLSVVLAGTAAAAPAAGQAPPNRVLHVSVTQKDGTPVTDLAAADFEVKAGGKPCEVVAAAKATTPMRLALIVADGGTGGFQYSLVTLVQRLQEAAEFAIVSVINQPDKLVDFTTDLDKVVEGLKRLGARGTTKASGQVIEAIDQTLKEIRQGDKRPVMIVMTVGGSGSTDVRADDVREALRKTGTLLYALSPAANVGRGSQVDLVLNDGSRDTGGRLEPFNTQNLVKIVEQIGRELANQYQLSYVLPDGVKPGDRLEITTKRKGLKVNAPSRIAD